jgi:hypothetical protein
MPYHYHNITKKYVIAFAHLFSDIHIKRFKDDNTVDRDIKVPIIFAGKDKMFYDIRKLPSSNDAAIVSQHLPRMGFIISSLQYDSTRQRNLNIPVELNANNYMAHAGVPYNFIIDLSVIAKTNDDMYQIIEQIAVMFTPDLTLQINEIPELEISRDVSINLDSISLANTYEFEDIGQRIISTDFSFTLKGNLYPAVSTDDNTNVIYNVINNYKNIATELPTQEDRDRLPDMTVTHTLDPITDIITTTYSGEV